MLNMNEWRVRDGRFGSTQITWGSCGDAQISNAALEHLDEVDVSMYDPTEFVLLYSAFVYLRLPRSVLTCV